MNDLPSYERRRAVRRPSRRARRGAFHQHSSRQAATDTHRPSGGSGVGEELAVSSYSDPAASGNPGIARILAAGSDLKSLARSRGAAARWLLVAIIGAVDWVWMARAGFHTGARFLQSIAFIWGLNLIGLFYCLTNRDDRIMRFAHFAAQYLALLAVMMSLSYLAVSTNTPLADPVFDTMDKAMGFDWVEWKAWVVAHPVLQCGLRVAYDSLPVQTLIAYIYNVHTRGSWRNNEIWCRYDACHQLYRGSRPGPAAVISYDPRYHANLQFST